MIASRETPEAGARSRYRLVGSAHVALAVLVNGVTGSALVYLGLEGGLIRWAFGTLERYVSAQTLLRNADLVVSLATTGVTVAGAAVLVLGAVLPVLARTGLVGEQSTWHLGVSAVSAVNPLALPLTFVGTVLLYLGRSGSRSTE